MGKLKVSENSIQEIINDVQLFLRCYSYYDFKEHIKETVIGQNTGVDEMCLQIYKWLISVANGNTQNHNTILAAPSGTGKTAFYYAIKNMLCGIRIPIINFDASSITPVGYVGKDYTNILSELTAVNSKCHGIGICFLDEIDKVFLSSPDHNGRNFHKEAQSCLLKMVEGSEYYKDNGDSKGNTYVNTANTLFIGMGAFQDIRECRLKSKSSTIGFGTNGNLAEEYSVFDAITDQDMVNYGAQAELIGRFEKIVNYSKLDKKALEKIIVKLSTEILPFPDWEIFISDFALNELMKFIDNERGIRFIRSKISDAIDSVLPTIFKEEYNDFIYEIYVDSLTKVSFLSYKREKKNKEHDISNYPSSDSWILKSESQGEIHPKTKKEPQKIIGDSKPQIDLPTINPGDKLNHKIYGEGVVIKVDDQYFTVGFKNESEKKFLLSDTLKNWFNLDYK